MKARASTCGNPDSFFLGKLGFSLGRFTVGQGSPVSGFRKFWHLSSISAAVSGVFPLILFGVSPEISLRSSNELIINTELRETALEVGHREIFAGQADFLATLEEVKSPFLPLNYDEVEVELERETKKASFSDETILEAVAARFSRQVRGSLTRGDITYLQVDGGSPVRPGASFPAKIPQIKDRTFEVVVESISPEGYVLALGDARVRLTFDRTEPASGRIQFTD